MTAIWAQRWLKPEDSIGIDYQERTREEEKERERKEEVENEEGRKERKKIEKNTLKGRS